MRIYLFIFIYIYIAIVSTPQSSDDDNDDDNNDDNISNDGSYESGAQSSDDDDNDDDIVSNISGSTISTNNQQIRPQYESTASIASSDISTSTQSTVSASTTSSRPRAMSTVYVMNTQHQYLPRRLLTDNATQILPSPPDWLSSQISNVVQLQRRNDGGNNNHNDGGLTQQQSSAYPIQFDFHRSEAAADYNPSGQIQVEKSERTLRSRSKRRSKRLKNKNKRINYQESECSDELSFEQDGDSVLDGTVATDNDTEFTLETIEQKQNGAHSISNGEEVYYSQKDEDEEKDIDLSQQDREDGELNQTQGGSEGETDQDEDGDEEANTYQSAQSLTFDYDVHNASVSKHRLKQISREKGNTNNPTRNARNYQRNVSITPNSQSIQVSLAPMNHERGRPRQRRTGFFNKNDNARKRERVSNGRLSQNGSVRAQAAKGSAIQSLTTDSNRRCTSAPANKRYQYNVNTQVQTRKRTFWDMANSENGNDIDPRYKANVISPTFRHQTRAHSKTVSSRSQSNNRNNQNSRPTLRAQRSQSNADGNDNNNTRNMGQNSSQARPGPTVIPAPPRPPTPPQSNNDENMVSNHQNVNNNGNISNKTSQTIISDCPPTFYKRRISKAAKRAAAEASYLNLSPPTFHKRRISPAAKIVKAKRAAEALDLNLSQLQNIIADENWSDWDPMESQSNESDNNNTSNHLGQQQVPKDKEDNIDIEELQISKDKDGIDIAQQQVPKDKEDNIDIDIGESQVSKDKEDNIGIDIGESSLLSGDSRPQENANNNNNNSVESVNTSFNLSLTDNLNTITIPGVVEGVAEKARDEPDPINDHNNALASNALVPIKSPSPSPSDSQMSTKSDTSTTAVHPNASSANNNGNPLIPLSQGSAFTKDPNWTTNGSDASWLPVLKSNQARSRHRRTNQNRSRLRKFKFHGHRHSRSPRPTSISPSNVTISSLTRTRAISPIRSVGKHRLMTHFHPYQRNFFPIVVPTSGLFGRFGNATGGAPDTNYGPLVGNLYQNQPHSGTTHYHLHM